MTDISALCERLRGLLAKAATDTTWRVWEGGIVTDAKDPANVVCLEPEHMMAASLDRWPDNAALITETINALPILLDALSTPKVSTLDADRERIARLMTALAKVMPIRVNDGADYAEAYFSDGIAHSTQAMTMNPQDWREIDAAYMVLLASPNASRGGPRHALPVESEHTEGCEHSRAPTWLCDCPRPIFAATSQPNASNGVSADVRQAFCAGFNAAERALGFEGCDESADALETEWAEYTDQKAGG